VLVQFSWWAYLLVDLNLEVYQHKCELLEMGMEEDVLSNEAMYLHELEKRWFMVAGEGLVFLTLLVIGIYKTRQSFRKEFQLARQQKNFLLSITHEFKSPLAAVKLNLQTLQKRHLSKEQMEHVLSNAISETDRIDNLVENALMATRIESKNLDILLSEMDISECANSVLAIIQATTGGDVVIESNIEPDIFILGDNLAISSLISNLVENSIKYSTSDPKIVVTLATKKNHATLIVKDNGIGISDSEKNEIFTKFYRVGNEETRRTKGTGLGLFIVKHVVDLHHGKIEVRDNDPKGTIFEVSIPSLKSTI
jgi:signal transduction histidine kinase